MTHGLSEQHFTSHENTKNWVDSWIASKDEAFSRRGIRMLRERWKSRGKRWTILRIKHKVPFFHNKFPIFDQNDENLFVHLIK